MKDKFVETFGYIDPKLVENAKPIAQKPIELRTEPSRFSWKKFTAAAACVAVLGAGSAAAIKMIGSQHSLAVSESTVSSGVSLSAADSGHSGVIDEIISSSPMTDDVSAPDTSSLPNSLLTEDPDVAARMEGTLRFEEGKEFEYGGKIYRMFEHGWSGGFSYVGDDIICNSGETFIVGVRREIIDGVDTVEFVAAFENFGTEPIGLMSSTASTDEPIIFRFELNDRDTEVYDSHHWFDDHEFRYMPVVIQPGEIFYQTASFPVTEAEYMFSTCFRKTNPDKFDESAQFEENSRGGQISNRWVDFSDKSVSFDEVYKLFGSSNWTKELQAAIDSRQ